MSGQSPIDINGLWDGFRSGHVPRLRLDIRSLAPHRTATTPPPTLGPPQEYQRHMATVRRSRVTRWVSSGSVFNTRSARNTAS
jgi:hypothetical protein